MKSQRDRMIMEIEQEVQYTSRYIGKNALDPRVMDAMKKVPREKFVPPNLKHAAFDNGPLPIGHGQTISQPYIVALMTDMLALEEDHTILEVGTGSGYQTAILSLLAKKVYSTEIVKTLSEEASERLKKLGYRNIETRVSDGYHGWSEHAPYDAIIVTAAAPHIPQPLIDQLKPGGKMAIPVGSAFMGQDLMLVEKDQDNKIDTRKILAVAFVPLTGDHKKSNPEATQ
jgi:protein-L-isoaspartate(D-aspartate) O-methyltransferase